LGQRQSLIRPTKQAALAPCEGKYGRGPLRAWLGLRAKVKFLRICFSRSIVIKALLSFDAKSCSIFFFTNVEI
jgi:hypothetical protein